MRAQLEVLRELGYIAGMKTFKKLPILCLSLTLLLSACAEDKAITDQVTRQRIQKQEERKKANQSQNKDNTKLKFEGSAVVVNMLERVSEALNYARVASELDTDSRISIMPTTEGGRLKVANTDLKFHNGNRDYQLAEDKEFDFSIATDSNAEKVFALIAARDLHEGQTELNGKVLTEQVIDPAQGGRSVNFVMKSYTFELSRDPNDSAKYIMALKIGGSFNGRMANKGGDRKGSEDFTYVITGKVDIDSLSKPTVVVTSLQGQYSALGDRDPSYVKFKVDFASEKMEYSYGECATIAGSLESTYSRKVYPLTISATEIRDANKDEKRGRFAYGECSKKPVVDLTKILENIGYYIK